MYVKRAKVFLLRTTMCTALLPIDTTKIPSEGSLRKWVVTTVGTSCILYYIQKKTCVGTQCRALQNVYAPFYFSF